MDNTMKELMKEFEEKFPIVSINFKPVYEGDMMVGIETEVNQSNMTRNHFDAAIMALATIVAHTEHKDTVEVFAEIIAKKRMTNFLSKRTRGEDDGDG